MNISAPFWGGSDWWRSLRGPSAFSNGRTAFQSDNALSIDDVRKQLMSASTGLSDAFRTFAVEIHPVFSTSTVTTASVLAMLSGQSARIGGVQGVPSILQTTVGVNTQTSTTRSSSSALGLDLTTAVSRLYSSALGLDVTSTPDPSQLNSSAALGLDITSPETVSALQSSAALGLNITPASSTITSTDEMNTATTSYDSSTLNFSGTTGTLTGTYTGVNTAAGATSLTVKITGNSLLNTLLATNLQFEVRDQANNLLFTFNGNVKAGDKIYLGNDIGLSISFSSGQLSPNQTASTTVSHAPVDVDPNATFNNSNPAQRPQFDNNAQVTAGSFTINGTSITVNANDTVNKVIASINASAAGVTASLANDKIKLTTNSPSEDNIVLANDTSGFLSASKLASAATVHGNIRDDQAALSKTTQFGSATSGSFTVNGVSISVNKDTDTLTSIINRINGSAAGVTASYDSAQDKVTLRTNVKSEDLITVNGDATGFLAAAKLSTNNTVRGNIRDDQQVFSKTTQFASVTSGSFSINGKTISVDAANDTLSTLITKINNAGSGVTASYDSTLDKIKLIGTSNSEDLITVANDNSGFLAAAHLATGNTVRGHIPEDQQVLSKLSQFGSVTTGSFTINGQTITVNPATDTVETLAASINNANAGVTAAFDSTSNKLVLTATNNGRDLITAANDTTGFLAAAGLSTGNTIRGKLADNQEILSNTSEFASVTSGTFAVNGVSIAVDSSHDTLQTLIGKINNAGAGVTASYNSSTDKVVFTPNSAGATLSLENDTSGFLAAAKIAVGTIGTHANADAAFNETGLNSPLFDPGVTVQAGNFSVNGVTITVAAADTINTVLGKITGSTAGVIATYDATAQTVKLASKQPSANPIMVGSDTSGFLAAVKLNGTAQSTPGEVYSSAFDSALNRMGEYSAVHAGTVSVNGHTISIDPATTTINAVVSALNSIPDVSTALDQTTGKLNISSKRPGVAITFSDTSGLLSTLGIASGTYNGTPGSVKVIETQTGTTRTSNASTVAASVSAAAGKVNDALAEFAKLVNDRPELRGEVETAVRSAIDPFTWAGIQGVGVDGKGIDTRVSVDPNKLTASLAQEPDQLQKAVETFTNQMEAFSAKRDPQLPPRDMARIQLRDMVAEASIQQQLGGLLLLNSLGSSSIHHSSPKQATEAYTHQMALQK